MSEITFKDLGLEPKIKYTEVKIGEDKILSVVNYLPIADKTNLITFVADLAIDEMTGCFSPVRVETYFAIAICRWYSGIVFEQEDVHENIAKTYDTLETNGVIDAVRSAIPVDELSFIEDLVRDTLSDIARYNNSAAGIIQMMNKNASGLDTYITDIMEKIKNGENLETLSVIKDVVGKD